MRYDSANQPLGRQLALTAKLVASEFNAALGGAGGSLPTWLVLNTLINGDWRNQQSVAQALGIEGATLTRHLDALEDAGLVVRRRDEHDRRSIHVEASDAGRELHRTLLGAAAAFDARLRAGFDDADLAQLRSLLGRLASNLAPPEA